NRPRDLAEPLICRRRTEPLAVVERRNSGNYLSRFNVVACRGFCSNDSIVADLQMSGDADLAGEYHAFPDDRTSREPCLRTNERIFIDRAAMADLHQAIYLPSAFHTRFTARCPVNARLRSDLDLVFDNHNASWR